jgi:hypothetical protein
VVNPGGEAEDVTYKVSALFPDGSAFVNCAKTVIAYPPMTSCELPVSARP